MALRKVRSNLDRLFDKSLTDLIRGIRNNKENEARYIASCIEEIKMELRQDSTYIKANAILKLAYLQMLGYDISWAAFNIIEVMASTKYTEKRIGYLVAAQCFHDTTEVLMLTTNLIRKDLNSPNMYDTGVALGGLSCFVTSDLAKDLASDIVNLLSSSRSYTRKRAVLLLYKIFLKYPEALRPTFPRLKEKLEDSDPGVQSAAVNVICELARKNPKNYLTLAPVFFKLMTTSSNNWMLIKIIKLLCVQKLGVLIEDSDQNLKYLGLLAMGKILQTHPKAVQAHKDIVLRCLDDRDESIRLRSLDLLYGMVSKKNITEIVKKLMEHVESAEGSHYRDELLTRIISICSYNNYQFITNFEWYISVLVELTKVEGSKHGARIAEQIQDVTVRVESIRHFSVSQMALLVENAHILLAGSAQQRNNISEVLLAAAWICGEYSQHVRNVQSVLESMLRARTSVISGHILSVYVQNIGKLYSTLLSKAEKEDDWDTIESLDNLMLSKLADYEYAEHLEAQDRACTLMGILRVVEAAHARREKIANDVARLYEGELNPVAVKAQRKVPVPEGLDLDKWIGPPWEETPESCEDSDTGTTFEQSSSRIYKDVICFGTTALHEDETKISGKGKTKNKEPVEITEEEMELRRKAREAERQSNPYYVKGAAAAPKRPTRFVAFDSLSANSTDKVNRADGEMPEDAKSTDAEDNTAQGISDEFRALDINLDEPLRPDEVVRGPQAYNRQIHKKKKKKRPILTEQRGIDSLLSEEVSSATRENLYAEGSSVKKTRRKRSGVAREAYEEASGICTPSNPNYENSVSTVLSQDLELSRTKLCSNSDIAVSFTSSSNLEADATVVITLSLFITSKRHVKDIEANIVDTLLVRMIRHKPGFLLASSIAPGETVELQVHLAIESNTVSQIVRGTVTYFTEEEEESIAGKLDFKLPLRSPDLLLTSAITKNEFSQLLTSTDVEYSASAEFISNYSFRDLLTRVTLIGHLSVVEEVGSAASLYARTTLGEPVCVLLKKIDENVHIGFKAGHQKLVEVLVKDFQEICTRQVAMIECEWDSFS
ncbi:adaptin region [Dictyocaulus viviparus]|uniref:Adaptin region n=1 Tax=Dictyocaulus viviparus TaxID=29172 RepID=A0A0D8XAV5_DICVI|nr:adaptin region [Dictyocaulus viviparus]